jgi:cell division protein FtsA
MPRSRSGILAVLDIGSTKIVCFIAQITPDNHLKIIGIGHQLSQGIKNGSITDIRHAENSIIAAVSAAEKMAGESIDKVVLSISGGNPSSVRVEEQIEIHNETVTPRDIKRTIISAKENFDDDKRRIIHAVPISFTIDDIRGVDDPIGMSGKSLTADIHLITASESAIKNISNTVSRCQLDVQDYVISSHAAGLSALTEDERELGVTLLEMGGGVTGISVFYHGKNIFTDSIPFGGTHVTQDIARGLGTSIACAERVKTLYGSAVASASDEDMMVEITQMNEDTGEFTEEVAISKAKLVGIIAPRMEEIFEMVKEKLSQNKILQVASQQIVLSGGACQLVGLRELAMRKLGKPVRIGRPEHIDGTADSTSSSAFAASAGLINYISMNYHIYDKVEPSTVRYLQSTNLPSGRGFFGNIATWVKENF